MKKKYVVGIFFIIIFMVGVFYTKSKNSSLINQSKKLETEKEIYSSNIIENVNYNAKDSKGNEYIINAIQGEIDINNSDVIYLTNVVAYINLKNSDNIKITSKYGKYNITNYDTIFSKNVIVTYLDNKINGGYLDFSIQRNTMIISKDVVYTNVENILKADVMEVDITTKDSKIFMHHKNKKVNVKSIN